MRVAIAVSEYHRRAGFPRHGAQLATMLAARGHAVTVLTRYAETDERDSKISFRFYSTVNRPTILHMAIEPYVVTRLLRAAAHEFDVLVSVGIPCLAPVVLVGPGTHRGWYLTSTSMLGKSPRRLIEMVRPFHRVVLAWERAMLRGRHPRLVVVPAEEFAREYVELYGFPRERIVLHPHAVEVDEFSFDPELRARTRRELGVGRTPVLLHVGGRGRQKGLDVLVRALESITDSDWLAIIAGGGSTMRSTQLATRSLRRRGRVRLLGHVDDVRALYCAADLLVFPSRYDPWGLVATEALACGLPVVCTRKIGAAVAVKDGLNGARINQTGDPKELKNRIADMLGRISQFDRQTIAGSVAWLSPRRLSEALESVLVTAPTSASQISIRGGLEIAPSPKEKT